MYSKQIQRMQVLSYVNDKAVFRTIFGWITTFICTLVMHIIVQNTQLNATFAHFLVIFSAALGMWVFRLVPESIPAVFIILTTLFFNFNPQHIILSGFMSDSFFLTLSLFGISCVLIKSQLFYRFSLFLLYRLPPSQSLLQKTLFAIGALMTPVISVQSARVTLMAPLLDDLVTSSKINPRSTSANALACAGFNGCILLSTIFLTGKSSNSVLYAMLSQHNMRHFSWFDWFFAASFPGALLTGLYFIVQSRFFKMNHSVSINKFRLKKELISLGTITIEEWAAIIGISTLLFGLFLTSWHHIPGFLICSAVFFVLFLTGAMEIHEFKTGINWSFLFYLGAIVGIMRYIQNIGIDLWLGNRLGWITDFADGNIVLIIVSIYLISWFCGLILGTMTAPALLFTVIVPVTQKAGINSWLVAFIILMATEAWIFPYQSNYFLCFEELVNKKKNFQLKSLLRFNTFLAFLKLGILLSSIPFWYCFKII